MTVYAPVSSSSELSLLQFYIAVDAVLGRIKIDYPNHALILLGDFNAHVRGYGSNTTDTAGEQLQRLCSENQLYLAPFDGMTFRRPGRTES